MPKLVRDLSKARTDVLFEVYDGPVPDFDRWYQAKITKCYLSESQAGNMMFNVSATLETKNDPDKTKRQYHGWFGRGRVMLLDNELAQQREKQFYEAISGSAKVNVLHDDIDGSDTSGTVKKINGANPIGKIVKVLIRKDNRDDYDNGVIDRIIASTDATTSDADDEAADEEADEVEIPDYESMSLKDLRAQADELKLELKSRTRASILAALEEYYNAEDEEEEEPEEDEEDEEDEEEIDYTALSLAELRAELKAREIAVPRGAKADALIALLEEDDEADEDEEEEEPEEDEEDEEADEDEEDEDEDEEEEPDTLTTEEAAEMDLRALTGFAARVGAINAKTAVGMTKVKLTRLLKTKGFINDEPPF